jgi:hypothetical protein
MSTWLEDMIDQPAFTNSRDFEYQCRRNMLAPEAEAIRDSEAEPRPVLEDKNSSAQKKCHMELVHKWEDKGDVSFFKIMDMLWNARYGSCPLIPKEGE